MITIQHGTTRYTVTEAHAARYRAMIDSGKLPKIKSPQSTPIWRDYPAFVPGMSTSDYVHLFNRQFDGQQVRIQHDCPNYHKTAPMLDAQWPEVVETPDPDYVEPPPATKARKATPAQLRKALENIAAIEPMATANVHDLWLAIGEIRRIAEGALK
jgi:hypothetical protein